MCAVDLIRAKRFTSAKERSENSKWRTNLLIKGSPERLKVIFNFKFIVEIGAFSVFPLVDGRPFRS